MEKWNINPSSVGIGFRPEAYEATMQQLHNFEVLEVMVDHYIAGGQRNRDAIMEVSQRVPVVGHGVGLSLGTAVPPDGFYLDQVAEVLDIIGAPWHSEHLAFTKVPGRDTAQLIPLPWTHEVAEVVIRNLEVVRKHIQVPFAIENITYYFQYPNSELSESEFLELVCRESGTYLLLDLENVYINSHNHGFDPYQFIDSFPAGLVKGVHVAGGVNQGELMIDSHDRAVPDPVLDMVQYLLARQTPNTIILERDEDLEPFDEVLSDVLKIKGTITNSRRLENSDSGSSS